MKRDMVTFKGINEGIYLEVYGSDIELIKKELDEKISKQLNFFQGMKFLGVKAEGLTPEQVLEISLILKYKYDFVFDTEEDPLNRASKIFVEKDRISDDLSEGMTKFLYGTLRSGQVIEYNGNIVVVGDVNPGAVLKATGNIIVLGVLKGVAYAGLGGNNDAIVAAYDFMPTQLKINDIIVRAPDGGISQYRSPEVAKIYGGEIIIEPYLPNK